ncbi:hypothetical protein ACEQ8H_006616 [Pleosporales sp. CAS-2024a]
MEALDANHLADRLKCHAKEYRLHVEAETLLDKYPAKQHARRVQEKLGVEQGLIYLPGQQAKNNVDSDMPAPFRQLRYFYYLSGCNEPDCHLTYDIQHDILTLFIPRINEQRVIWYGRGPTLAEARLKFDIDEVYYNDQVSDHIADWFHHNSNKGCLYTLHGKVKSVGGGRPIPIDSTSLQPAVDAARVIKDDHEIQLIRKANDISSKAHREVLANILTFTNEAQVQGLFLDICISHQAKRQAYDPIAASGPNAGTLHYDANNEDFGQRQLMCLDAGCEYQLYASDITRTFPLSPSWPSKEAASIYKLVERMQDSCIDRLAPGQRFLDLHILAHQIAIDGLLALGILHNGTREEIYKAGTSKAFFPHGLGHHVGLEVHDVGHAELMSIRRGEHVAEQWPSLYPANFHLPVYDPKTCYAPVDSQSGHLEEGMIVTVEPGIYFSRYALHHFYLPSPIHAKYINVKTLERFMPVGGVRIEDDILITSKGHENLSTAPKGDAMLDIIRRQSSDVATRQTRTWSARPDKSEQAPPLVRAPGISNTEIRSMLQPIARAATMPVGLPRRPSFDFEPCSAPSLYSNFKPSMTAQEKILRWQKHHEYALASQQESESQRQRPTVCGNSSKEFQHVYLSTGSPHAPHAHKASHKHHLPACQQCAILCETLQRLRQSLSVSEKKAPAPEEGHVQIDSRGPSRRKAHEKSPSRTQKTSLNQAHTNGEMHRHQHGDRMLDLMGALSSIKVDDDSILPHGHVSASIH